MKSLIQSRLLFNY